MPVASTLQTSSRVGAFIPTPKIPCVVGYEVSGIVDETGSGVNQSRLGKDVFALIRFGGYSDVVIAPEKQVFEKPASVSHARAAAIPVNYLTAWQLLVVMGSLNFGETVLIHNAGGGADVACHIGATIYGTASSDKHAFFKAARSARSHRLPGRTARLSSTGSPRGADLY